MSNQYHRMLDMELGLKSKSYKQKESKRQKALRAKEHKKVRRNKDSSGYLFQQGKNVSIGE